MRKFCLECKTWVLKDSCNCSSPRILISNKSNRFDYKEGKIVCGCGNHSFKRTSHIDTRTKAIWFYECSNCNSGIKIENKRDMNQNYIY